MARPLHAIGGSILGLLAACSCADRGLSIDGPEPTTTSLGDASSDGEDGGATSGLSAGESTFAGEDSTGHGTTAEPVPSARARVLAFGTHAGTVGLWYLEYESGAVSEPVSIATVADESTPLQGLVTSPSRAFAAYRSPSPRSQAGAMLVDLRDGPPPSPSPIATAPAANPSPWIQFVPSETAIVFETDGGTPEARIWITTLDDGAPQPPQLVAGPAPMGSIVRPLREIASDDTWMLVEISPADDDGASNVWLAPLSTPDPSALLPVSTIDQQGHVAEYVRVLPGDTGVIYRSRDASFVRDLWLVPIDAGVPASPMRIDVALPAPKDTWEVYAVQVLEAGNGLVYWTAEQIGDTYGELWFVPLEGATAGTPLPLGPPAEADVKLTQIFSSPDGRWVAYSADDPVAGDRALWLVDVTGRSPSEPVRVADPGVTTIVTQARFDLDSAYLYYELGAGAAQHGLYRSDVSGPAPGPPQLVSAHQRDGAGGGSIVAFSWDDRRIAHGARHGSAVDVVDVASPEPSTPLTLDVACTDLWFSADADALVFTDGPARPLGKPLFLVDLVTGAPPVPLLDGASFVRVLAD